MNLCTWDSGRCSGPKCRVLASTSSINCSAYSLESHGAGSSWQWARGTVQPGHIAWQSLGSRSHSHLLQLEVNKSAWCGQWDQSEPVENPLQAQRTCSPHRNVQASQLFLTMIRENLSRNLPHFLLVNWLSTLTECITSGHYHNQQCQSWEYPFNVKIISTNVNLWYYTTMFMRLTHLEARCQMKAKI